MGKAILFGPVCAELGWIVLRAAPHAIWQKIRKYKNEVKLIVLCRPDCFDLFGKHADILDSLILNEKNGIYDCFKFTGISLDKYHQIAENFYKKYYTKYRIITHIYPTIEKRKYTEKNQFSSNQLDYNFKPRPENKILVDKYISDDKPLITIAPRFRKGIKRNWPYWEEFYNLIYKSEYMKNFNFIICGKSPEYIKDSKNIFYDINDIPLTHNTSLIGVTMETIKKSILTVGSQSGIPNLSLMMKTRVLEWGNEKRYHTVTYNPKKTNIKFLDDYEYKLPAKTIFKEMCTMLKEEMKKNAN